jgi:pyruvate dehydrogenase E1 component beta subunit
MPYPPAKLEGHYLPDLDRILDGVDRVLGRVEPFVPASAGVPAPVPDAGASARAAGSPGATRTAEAVAR